MSTIPTSDAMQTVVVYTSAGQIVHAAQIEAEFALGFAEANKGINTYLLTTGSVGGDRHYVTGGAVVPFPAKPSVDHVWDWSTRAWGTALPDATARRLAELHAKRDSVINSTFIWNGSEFDSDQVSQTRILGLYTSAVNTPAFFPLDWRLADNSKLPISAVDAVGVWSALQLHIQGAFSTFWAHEAAINALTTVATVQAYDLTTGW